MKSRSFLPVAATGLLAAALLAGTAGCSSPTAGTDAGGQSHRLVWDLRKGVHIKDLGLSQNTADLPDTDVSITLSDGEVYSAQGVTVMVDGSLKDPTLVDTIRVGLGNQSIDEAYRTAQSLGPKWGLPAKDAKLWHDWATQHPGYTGDSAGSRKLAGGNSIALFMAVSVVPEKPVLPEFTIDDLHGIS